MLHEVDKQKMEVLQDLANINLKIGEAKGTLLKLQETETEYLEEREKKAVQKIEAVLAESKDLLKEVYKNYDEIHQFYNTVASFAGFLEEVHEKFKCLVADFDKRSLLWDTEIKKQQGEMSEMRKLVDEDRRTNEETRKALLLKEADIKKDKTRIESQRAQIKSALDLLNKKNNG